MKKRIIIILIGIVIFVSLLLFTWFDTTSYGKFILPSAEKIYINN